MWQISDRFSVSATGVLEGFDAGWFYRSCWKCYEITSSLFVTYYRKCWRMFRYKSGNDYGSSIMGSLHTFLLMSENTWTMFSPNRWIGRGGPVQWSPCFPDLTPMDFFICGEMKCLVYETPIDTPEELVARAAEAAAIIRETQSFAHRYQLCINVNGRHFQRLL